MAFEIEIPKRGGASLFKPFHLLKVLYYLREEGSIGRKSLSKIAGVGEGTARKISQQLIDMNYTTSTDAGLKLTRKGSRFLKEIGIEASSVDAGELTVDTHDFAVKLKGSAEYVSNGLKERDEAIKADATGVTTVLFQNNNLVLPDHYDVDADQPDVAKKLRTIFSLHNGDVILIGTAPTRELAEDGAFAAAVSLISDQKA